jgi:hypothetical protein
MKVQLSQGLSWPEDACSSRFRFSELLTFQVNSWRLLSLLLLCSINSSIAQSSDTLLHATATIHIETARLLTSDKLQQCYVVNEDNELFKYDKNGQLLFQYNNNQLGDLEWLDVTDPFNILLFYPDYFTVILLNRTLNITGEYQLFDLNITDVNAVAMANDNELWFFDDNTGKVRKVSRAGDVTGESVNVKLLLGINIQALNMLATRNRVFLNAPEFGILVFDNFGTYLKDIPLKGLASFQILENQLIYQEGGKIKSFHLQSFLTSEVELPFKLEETDQLQIQKGVLLLLKGEELLIYNME